MEKPRKDLILSATPATAPPTAPMAPLMPSTMPWMMSAPHWSACSGRDFIQSIAAVKPSTMASLMAVTRSTTAVLMLSKMPEKMPTAVSQIDVMMVRAPEMIFFIISQMAAAMSLMAVHAPSQSPVKTLARKLIMPAMASRNGCIRETSVFQMVLNTVMMVSPQVSQNRCKAPKMTWAASERAFQSVTHRVLMPSQMREKDSMTASPFSSHQADRAPKMVCAACLMTPQAVSRNSFTVLHAFRMVWRAFSAPMPALSNKEPMRLFSPFMKAMKSWTSRAMTATTAIRARTLSLAAMRVLSIFWRADRRDSTFGIAMTPKAAAATVPMSRNRFCVPPSLSASHSTLVWALRRTSMPRVNALTIVVPMAWEMPRDSSISATHRPNWLRMFSRASEILKLVPAKAAAISSALSVTAPARSARVILPSDTICSSWSEVVPSLSFSRAIYSGDCSSSWLMVSVSTTPRAKELLMDSMRPEICSLVLPAVLNSMVTASL